MYFDLRTFLRQKAFQATHGAGSAAWLLTAAQLTFYPLIHLGFAVDELLYPAIRNTAVRRPLFIVSCPRSGSTLLLHLLAADPANACHRTSELLFPSPALRRYVPQPFFTWADGVFRRRFASLDSIHPIRFDHAEEDEFLFLLLGNSGIGSYLFPYGAALDYLAVERFWEWPLEKRERFARYYHRCIQRLLWARASTRYVGKSPHFLGKIADLWRWYPDARFVYLIRSPYQSIPSALSMITTIWRLSVAGPPSAQALEASYRALLELARHGDRELRALPEGNVAVLPYTDLVTDVRAAIQGLYAWLGWPLTADYWQNLTAAAQNQRQWTSEHRYSAEEFGLSPTRIREDFAFIFDRYTWADETEPTVNRITMHSSCRSQDATAGAGLGGNNAEARYRSS